MRCFPPFILELTNNVNISNLEITGTYEKLQVGVFTLQLPNIRLLMTELLIINQHICKFNSTTTSAEIIKTINSFMQNIPSFEKLYQILQNSVTGELKDIVKQSKMKKAVLGCALMVHRSSALLSSGMIGVGATINDYQIIIPLSWRVSEFTVLTKIRWKKLIN